MKLTDIQTHSDYLDLADVTDLKKWQLHRKRVEFGRQHLTLGMFVPCDLEGNVLEEPEICFAGGGVETSEYIKYKQAKEKVLFEGFEYCERDKNFLCVVKNGHHLLLEYKNKVEELTQYDLTLTPNAIKQLGL